MPEPTDRTATALLEGLMAPDAPGAWEQFDVRYRPIVLAVARRMGLNETDAADAAQDAIVRFLTAYRQGKYDRKKGRLRTWLIGIARHCIADTHARRAARAGQRGESVIGVLADPDVERAWDDEIGLEVLRRALAEVRRTTKTGEKALEAFELVAVRGVPAAQAAEMLGMTTQDVYVAKGRVAERLRDAEARARAAFEEDPA